MTGLVVAVGLAFVGVALLIVWWARGLSRQQSAGPTERERYIALATVASANPGGPEFLALLSALETAGPACPVRVEWVRRSGNPDRAADVMLKITWDGNEWRRGMDPAALALRLRAELAADARLDSPRAQQLLATLDS